MVIIMLCRLEHGEVGAGEGAEVVGVELGEEGAAEHRVDRHHDAQDQERVRHCRAATQFIIIIII